MRMSEQSELVYAILDKCQKLKCNDCNEVAEMLGGATLIILKMMGDLIGIPLDEMRETYVKALEHAKQEEF